MSEEITGIVINDNLMSQMHDFPAVQASCQATAEAIANRARELAPVETGAYRDGIVVNRAQTKGGVWRVAATDGKSSWIEFGNSRQAPQFVMRSAVESLGLSFKKRSA